MSARVTPAVRASRILARLEGYESPAPEVSTVLQPEEVPLGIYRNEGATDLLFTDQGLHVLSEDPCFVPYARIVSVQHVGPKATTGELQLSLDNGQAVSVPVTGGNERCRDAFEIMRYLDRVRSDLFDA